MLIEKYIGGSTSITYTDKRAGDVPFSLANIDRLKTLGLTAPILLEDGLKKTIEWYQKNLTKV